MIFLAPRKVTSYYLATARCNASAYSTYRNMNSHLQRVRLLSARPPTLCNVSAYSMYSLQRSPVRGSQLAQGATRNMNAHLRRRSLTGHADQTKVSHTGHAALCLPRRGSEAALPEAGYAALLV